MNSVNKMPHNTLVSVISALCLVLLTVTSISCTPAEETTQEESRPLAVETVTLTEGRLISSLETSAPLQGIEEASLVSEAQGTIKSVQVKLGDYVNEGDVIAQVDDLVPRLNSEQAFQQLETARIEWNTQKQLAAQGSSSRVQLALTESNYRGAEAQYQTARKAYEDCTLKAPISGYIASLDPALSRGNYLTRGKPVARVVNTSSLQVRIALGEDFVGLIEEGSPAMVEVPAACPGKQNQARVSAIAAGSDTATGSYPVILTWENSCGSRIRSGMTALVTISPEKAPQQLLVPTAALVERQGQKGVFLFVPGQGNTGTAQFREARFGLTMGDRTEVIEGLSPGEEVIITGLITMADETPVTAENRGESGSWD